MKDQKQDQKQSQKRDQIGHRTRHAIFISVALIVGLAAGAWIYRIRQGEKDEALNAKIRVRVLALSGVFKKPLLQKLEDERHIHVDLVEAADPEALWDIFDAAASTHFDLVTLMSYQVPAAIQMTRIIPMSTTKMDWSHISSDFRAIPGDTNHNRVLPILWGLSVMLYNSEKLAVAPESWQDVFEDKEMRGHIGLLRAPIHLLNWTHKSGATAGDEESDVGPSDADLTESLKPIVSAAHFSKTSISSLDLIDPTTDENDNSVVEMNLAEAQGMAGAQLAIWKNILPAEFSPLWILSLAITTDSKLDGDNYALLNALMEPDLARLMITTNHQASTLTTLDGDVSLPKAARPSYIREIPLTKIQTQHDFQGARAAHAAIEGDVGITESTSE